MKLKLLSGGNSIALAGADFETTYDTLCRRALNLSAKLPAGISKAAIFMENAPEWAYACYAAWSAGAAVIPIDAKSNVDEVAFVLSDSEPDVLFVSPENLAAAKQAALKAASKAKITVVNGADFSDEADARPQAAIERDFGDLGLIVYTSGTTGNPKGVMLTFANMAANMRAVAEAKYFFPKMRVLAMLPFHHILPLMGTLIMPLSIEGTVVFPKSISPADIAQAMQKYPIDLVVSVPRFYEMLHSNIMAKLRQSKIARAMFALAKFVDSIKFSQKLFGAIHKKFGEAVKFWVTGGAALDKNVWSDLKALGFNVCEGYGMTECAPIISFPRIGKIKMGSPGQPLQGIEVKIVDGEIAVRGENVTSGYYRRPDETAESIKDGWLYTGDLGYIDKDGFLFITGRRKEIIVLANGKNLNPAEMEAALQSQSPLILEAAVLMHQNTLHAIVRVPPALIEELGLKGAEAKMRDEAVLPYNRAAAMYKRIIKITLTTAELPRTRVGKLRRHMLPRLAQNAPLAAQPAPEPQSKIYAQLKSVLEKQISLPASPDAHMEMDLGLDSLGKIAMQCFVEENYGWKASERDFEKFNTLRLFAEAVEKNRDAARDGALKSFSWPDIIKSSADIKLEKPNALHFATVAALKALAKLLYKVEYFGVENLSENAPVIVAPNHQSYVDGLFATGTLTKRQFYKTYVFAKVRSYIKSGFIRRFADKSNVIIMDINDNVRDSIGKLAKALKEGNRVLIFPEGTRTKDGNIAEFKSTFAIMAKEMNIPVVPVCISGAFEKIKAGHTLPAFGSKIKVRFLKQMSPLADETYEAFASRVRAEIENALNTERQMPSHT